MTAEAERLEVVVGVTGGIAAYKVCEVVRRLRELGHGVTVVPTENSLKFVGAATWEALSGRKVQTRVFESIDEVAHVAIGARADLVLVAPVTANFMARLVHGVADDLLTSTLLATSAPVVLFPAMHTGMWLNAATVANVETLRARGITVVTPDVGRLTGPDSGIGRLPDAGKIIESALSLARAKDLIGRKVLVSAGGTREAIDPVRYLGNRSSGRQGFALAKAAHARGAEVTLVAAHVEVEPPVGVTLVRVESALELAAALAKISATQDVIIMAAAVADFRPAALATSKIKKDGAPGKIDLVENPDILAALATQRRPGQVIVGFAAETGDEAATVVEHGLQKLRKKGADLLVINDVSEGKVFGTAENGALIASSDGELVEVPYGSKDTLAHAVIDAVVKRLT